MMIGRTALLNPAPLASKDCGCYYSKQKPRQTWRVGVGEPQPRPADLGNPEEPRRRDPERRTRCPPASPHRTAHHFPQQVSAPLEASLNGAISWTLLTKAEVIVCAMGRFWVRPRHSSRNAGRRIGGEHGGRAAPPALQGRRDMGFVADRCSLTHTVCGERGPQARTSNLLGVHTN